MPATTTAPTVNLQEDSHIHTRLCNHASGEMEEYVLAAIDRGLASITFLEHLEVEIRYRERTWLTEADFRYYFREGERLREKYRDRLKIQLGVEVGYNPLAADLLKSRLNDLPWDRAGLSYHFLFDGEKHLNMVSRRQENIAALAALGSNKVMTNYLDGLIRGVRELDCQILCHLDAVMRHSPGLRFDPSHWEQIELLLKLMRDKGMALELNTSGFTLRGIPYPCLRIVHRAMELGITLTAGSDSHRPDQVGRDFDRLPAFLAL